MRSPPSEIVGYSVPFFFEPNFDALVKPLATVIREQVEGNVTTDSYKPVIYGDFLKAKVGSNFADAADENVLLTRQQLR